MNWAGLGVGLVGFVEHAWVVGTSRTSPQATRAECPGPDRMILDRAGDSSADQLAMLANMPGS